MYSGFTGDGNNKSNKGSKSSSASSGTSNNDDKQNSNSYLKEFYRLPSLSKLDQVEIIGELTKGSEVNMTPSKLVETLNDYIIS